MVCIHNEILLTMKGEQSCYFHDYCATGVFLKINRSGTHRGDSRALTYTWDLKGWSQAQWLLLMCCGILGEVMVEIRF